MSKTGSQKRKHRDVFGSPGWEPTVACQTVLGVMKLTGFRLSVFIGFHSAECRRRRISVAPQNSLPLTHPRQKCFLCWTCYAILSGLGKWLGECRDAPPTKPYSCSQGAGAEPSNLEDSPKKARSLSVACHALLPFYGPSCSKEIQLGNGEASRNHR